MPHLISNQRYLLPASLFCLILCLFGTTAGFAQQVQKPNTTNYSHGITLFESGLYEQSANELEQFIARHPRNPLVLSAKFYRVRALAAASPKNARKYYQRFIAEYPQSAFTQKILLNLAHKEMKAGEYKQAVSHYKRALKRSITKNQSAKIYYWLAEAEKKNENYDKARQYYAALANQYPDTKWAPKALYARGRLLLKKKKFKKASNVFQLVLKRYPRNDIKQKIGIALGQAYMKQHKYHKAIDALKENLPYLEGKQKKRAVLLLGESYNGLNKFKNARAKYLQYINLTKGTPKERAAHYGMGWIYFKQGIYHWAAREFGEAAHGNDKLARKALYFEAISEKLADRYGKAINTFQEFATRFSKGYWYEHAIYEWAITYYQMGNYPGAIETLLKLVRSNNDIKMKGKVFTLLGQAYFANKEYTRALKAYNIAEGLADIKPRVERKVKYQKAWMQYYNQAYEAAQEAFAHLYHNHPNTEIGKKALFWEANAFYQMNQFSTAAQLFRDFIEKYPHDKLTGPALYSLGWSYFEMGQYQNAVEPFRRFLRDYKPPKVALYPYNTDAILRMGDSYYALSKYQQAIQAYKKAVNDNPGGDYAMFQIGNSYFRNGQIYLAVKTFREFGQRYPKSSLREQAQYNIAYIYLNTGNFQQAIREFKRTIKLFPNSHWAARSQFNIGDAYYNQGKYQKAIKAYQKVMKNYPQSDYLIEAANSIRYAKLAAQGGKKVAVNGKQTLDKASVIKNFIKNNPNAKRAADRLRFNRAEGLVVAGDYIKAIQKLKKYIKQSKNAKLLPKAYFLLAKSYKKTNHLSNAVNTYETIVQKYSGSDYSSRALSALGRMMYQQQKYQKAYQYYQRLATRGGTNRSKGYVGLGNIKLAQGQIKEAKSKFKMALSINSNSQAAEIGLAKVAVRSGNYKRATQKLRPIARNNTGKIGAEAQYYLGVVQQMQMHYKQALQAYAKLRTLYQKYDHWVAMAMLKSGRAYFKLGKSGQGLKVLQSLISAYPQSRQALAAQQLIKKYK